MKYTDENVQKCFATHPEVDMHGLAYIYACQDRATGIFGFIRMRYWLIGWDGRKLHLIETTLAGKELSYRSVTREDIESAAVKPRIVNTRINLKIRNEEMFRFDATSKVMGLKNQKEHLETILNILKSSG